MDLENGKKMDHIMEYVKYLEELIPEKDNLKIVRLESEKYYKAHFLMSVFVWA